MNRFNTFVIYALSVLLLALLLPWILRFATSKPAKFPFTLYSSVAGDFVRIVPQSSGETIYESLNGKHFTENEFDSILPYFYYRQLASTGRLPEGVTAQQIRQSNFIFRSSPSDINKPEVRLYPLLESKPKRVDLQLPPDVFRMTSSGIEFIDMESNKVNQSKSEAFSKAFRESGFSFPCKLISGDPNPKKEYDNGYMLTDSKGIVYNLRMADGKPIFQKLDTPVKVTQLFIAEFPSRKFLAFAASADGGFYAISAADRSWHRLPFEVDLLQQSLMIIGNMDDWTVQVSGRNGSTLYAVNANNYSLISKMDYPMPTSSEVSKYIFPFELSLTTGLSNWVKPIVFSFSAYALALNALLAAVGFWITRRKWASALVLPLGVFLFIPLMIFHGKR